ncbi:interferon a3-like [Polyodon spathula]|uniref:IFNb1 n=1 Tax=Polyodon spathula TaxID=7913 RepID=A0AAU7YBV7_POLSP|nr:interferon a3-like [Polyodon spathula]
MAFENVFAVCCIVLCFWSPTFSKPMRCRMNGHLTQINKQLLIELGGNFPVQCKKENVAIAVPLDAYEITEDSQIEDIKMTIYEVLNDVNKIFLSGPKPASWNKTNLDNFHNILHRQIHGVKQCVQVRAGAPQGSHLVLKAYFKKLQNVLQDKDYSFCAWEIVRKEAVNTLTQVQLLMDKAEIE